MFATPEDVLKTWMFNINNGEINPLLAMYEETAILIPTFSNRVSQTPARIRTYFETLASREDLSVALHEKTLVVQPIRDQLFLLCGIYCWRFAVEGELLSFEARFSLLVDLALASPILHHHTSQIPRTL